MLSAHRVGKQFGERTLFSGLSFEINEHDKVGLVGENGCGKTTLFRMLTGEYSIDEGDVVFAKNARVGYLEQHACSGEEHTLWDEVEAVFAPVIALEKELAAVTLRLQGHAAGDAALIERQHRLQEEFDRLGGSYYKSRVRSTLLGLGFPETAFSQPVSSLSGGQKSKAAMGRLLLSEANVLLLDEPTNHLDITAVEWLEEFLRNYQGTVVVISHDRYFLDRVTTRTLEIANGRLYATSGNYSAHRAARDKDKEVEAHHYKTQMRAIHKLEDNITLLKSWNREKSIRAAESREKRLERLRAELTIPESERDSIRFDFTAEQVSGNEVLNAGDITMGFDGRTLFKNAELHIRRGERVFLIGPNGCGKTTLLKILANRLTPKSGYVLPGAKVRIGYYDQTQAGLDDRNMVIDEIWDSYPRLTQTEVRNALAAFLFRGDDVFSQVGKLSGGERARILLLKLMLARDNFLLLDEPTNHLDITSCEALEAALSGYDGTVLIVSHDRYFIDRLATRVVRLTEEGCESFPGGYTEYLEKFTAGTAAVAAVAPPKENAYKQRKEAQSARRKQQTRLARCEEAITEAETQAAALQERMNTPEVATDYARLAEVTAQWEETCRRLDELMVEWETLQLALESE